MQMFQRLMLWWLLHRGLKANMNIVQPPLTEVPIFQLGNLLVYTFKTQEELVTNALYTKVYWRDITVGNCYGAFNSVHEAMQHYTNVINNQTPNIDNKGHVVYVDFRNKKRITYG